jgi:hypothetical protein
MSTNIGNTVNINIGVGDVGGPSGAGPCSAQGAQAQQCMQSMDPLQMLAKVLGEVANVIRAAKSG